MNGEPPQGERVDILHHRGEADVWYRDTVIDGGRALLDAYPHGDPTTK